MQRYQWLLFDADNTLFDFNRAEAIALQRAFQLSGIAFAPDHQTVYRRLNQALWQAVELGELTPAAVKVRRFEELLAAIQVDFPPAEFSAHYIECLAGCGHLVPGAEEVLAALHGKYRLAILTNGLQEVQRRRLTASPIGRYIEAIVVSEEIGASKPAREFFEIALARLGNPARDQVLMIGDSWVSDMQGAMNSGIDACWFNPERQPVPAGAAIQRELASLRELLEWLGN